MLSSFCTLSLGRDIFYKQICWTQGGLKSVKNTETASTVAYYKYSFSSLNVTEEAEIYSVQRGHRNLLSLLHSARFHTSTQTQIKNFPKAKMYQDILHITFKCMKP